MPDQQTDLMLMPSERRAVRGLIRRVNSGTPEFWREADGTLMAMTIRRDGDFGYVYRYNPRELRWNEAGRACGHGVSMDEHCHGCDEGNAQSDAL